MAHQVDEEILRQAFADGIQIHRKRAGLSQRSLGDAAGLSRASIVNIEQGRQLVSIGALYRLAAAMNCDPADLLPALDRLGDVQIRMGSRTPSAVHAVAAVLKKANESEDQA